MPSSLSNSLFSMFVGRANQNQIQHIALLGGHTGSRFSLKEHICDLPIVVFDFETTGLNVKTDRIIELGAVKFKDRKEVGRFSTFVHPGKEISTEITQITGITNEMLKDAPPMEQVLEDFHDFLRGCLGIAHNAEFDSQLMKWESQRLGIHCDYFVVCTLKMARQLVLQIENRKLDTLAKHFGLTFQSRHRSIGDILVTAEVFWKFLDENPRLKLLENLVPFQELMA
jgi:DNA polymerase III subunit epsilon